MTVCICFYMSIGTQRQSVSQIPRYQATVGSSRLEQRQSSGTMHDTRQLESTSPKKATLQKKKKSNKKNSLSFFEMHRGFTANASVSDSYKRSWRVHAPLSVSPALGSAFMAAVTSPYATNFHSPWILVRMQEGRRKLRVYVQREG